MARKVRHPATHLTTSRHGVYCFRIPIPRNSTTEQRRFVQLSLGTRDPDKAQRLSRALQVETEAFMENMKRQVRDADGVVIPYDELNDYRLAPVGFAMCCSKY